ncbi:hypothetical protein HPB49_010010 [Dermacentor silvarum]|uniref:Uncharacterized protein n=1 Tax=Dermacentor silvarum TaxID=543639 RepID=A0ACB8CR01_DERSI|nr:hypothetical protein HPB49_010010 [Dermacentor silvarum]
MASSFPAQAPAAKRAKYEAKDLAAKVQILKALQVGASRKEVMEKFQVKKSTVRSYVKNEDQIMQAYDGDMFGDKRKRLRTAAHPKLQEALLCWIAVSRDAQLPLSGPLICAQKFALSMNIDSFNASEHRCALHDYFAIDNDVAIAGIVTDSDIVTEVMDGEGESVDEDPNESDERPRPTMTEAAQR